MIEHTESHDKLETIEYVEREIRPTDVHEDQKLAGKRKRYPIYQWIAGVFSTAALLGSLYFARYGWGQKIETGGRVKILQVIVLVAWTLLPPIWFWAEYIFLFRGAYPNEEKHKLESLKTQQDLSSKIWIAVASVLLILYFWKDIGR
jgi:hypothetical protein